jgi:hypothetical protein
MHVVARQIGVPRRSAQFWKSKADFATEAGLFVLGVSGAYSANIIGALPGCEILILPLLPALLVSKGRRAFRREYFWFYVLVGAWLLGTLIADEYNGIGAFNRSKGIARVVFFACDFMALAILINDKARRMVVFGLSIAFLMLIGSFQFLPDFDVVWKFGMAESIAIVALLVSSHFYTRRRYWICFLISFGLAGLNLIFGFRSQLAVHFVSAVLILPLPSFSKGRSFRQQGNQSVARALILIFLAFGAAYAANSLIGYASRSGFFDQSTQAKFESQAHGDYGVLVGGRPETLVAIQAIRDSPIIGHGSFPYGPEYVQLQQDIQYEHGYSDTDEPKEVEYPVIPSHSHLTLAWVEGGILGGICWIYVLVLVVRAVFRVSTTRPNLAPLYGYFLVAFIWDILYSPFGSVNRILAAYYILLSYGLMKSPIEAARHMSRRISVGNAKVYVRRIGVPSAPFLQP